MKTIGQRYIYSFSIIFAALDLLDLGSTAKENTSGETVATDLLAIFIRMYDVLRGNQDGNAHSGVQSQVVRLL